MSANDLRIVGVGAVTAIGLDPGAVAAAAAAGISRVELVETMRDARTGAPVPLALLSTLPIEMSALERMSWMAERAATQALAGLTSLPGGPQLRAAVLVSVPPTRPGLDVRRSIEQARKLFARLPAAIVRDQCALYDTGHEGGITALLRARDLLARGLADVCLVGGVESYCDPDVLDWLARSGRLKNDDTPSGLIPGEGAAFVLVTTEQVARPIGLASLGAILGLARAEEPAPWYMGQPTQGRGLTRAIAGAFQQQAPDFRAETTYCDASGEPWRADEWSFAYLRTGERHGHPLALRHPADCWGDVGAASAPLLLVTALVDLRWDRGGSPRALVWCASDTRPYRGAALIQAFPER
jgi:3-oxoacyl-[acyl-carrier-protein] synthase-1